MPHKRSTPEQSLVQAKLEETKKGKLKIFFGACAGVGKTIAMLQAAKEKFNENLKVMVGIIETHGRAETTKVLQGLPILPLKTFEYQGIQLKELDIDAAIDLKPDILVVDELAHTNVIGSRHPKRWQDVQEFLAHGIDVYTTLNVQHLESLNDLVKKITGITIKETVPDSIFDNADEIVLVDIPSEIILDRLSEGKVYLGEFAKQRAAQHFFKIENLVALREIALRKTAEKVDAIRQIHKKYDENKPGLTDKILVCIPPTENAIKLIRQAKQLSTKLRCDWTALYIENDEFYDLSSEAKNEITSLLNLAERLGAKTEIIQKTQVTDAIVEYVQKNHFTKLLIGKTRTPKWKRYFVSSTTSELLEKIQFCDLIITSDSMQTPLQAKEPATFPFSSFAFAVLILAIATLMGLPAKNWLEPQTVLMLYIAGIVLIAMSTTRTIAIFSVILAAALYNFFFTYPYYHILAYDWGDFITLSVLLLTSFMISSQTYRLRQQTLFASQREKYASHMLELSRKLMIVNKPVKIAETLNTHISDLFNAVSIVWSLDNDNFEIIAPAGMNIDIKESSVAIWVFNQNKRAGIGTDTMPSALGYYFPITYGKAVYGVLGVILKDKEKQLDREQLALIEALLVQGAMAFERARD